MNKLPLTIRDCGLCEYGPMLEEQKSILEDVHKGAQNTVLLVEHESVITLGARQSENKFVKSEEEIKDSGIDLFAIRRGGGTTAHNPGQLVIYPIVNLRTMDIGINEFIRELEQIGIDALAAVGVESERKKGLPGLWIGEEKIASIGVKVSMGITYHGMAINVCNDLSIFNNIVPCGIDNVIMTSVEKQGKTCSIEDFKKVMTKVITDRWVK
ncbi:MAG: lipoyl(octanoyl) transferase LipB [Sedimentisphaeraceae bacterium JB056]